VQLKNFEQEASKPGKIILLVGISLYVISLIAFLIATRFNKEIIDKAILVLLIVPISLPLLTIIFIPGIFFTGTLLGMPYVSFSHILSRAKYYWRSICGIILLIAVVIALIVIV